MPGGRVELIVSKSDSNSPVLTRTIGDPSTGTQVVPLPPDSPPPRPSLDPEPDSTETVTRAGSVQRPTFVQLPSPRSFTLDNGLQPSSSSSLSPPIPKVPSRAGSSTPTPTVDPGLEVLVVDDDPLTRMLMKRLLARLGCSVSTAENGEIALEMILGPGNYCTPSTDSSGRGGPILEQSTSPTDYKYHIIFLDNQMPVMSGLKTVEKLRDFGRGDFVVGVTGKYIWE